jgi:hypothetical protein
MEPDKLATAIQDIQMHDADDPPASKRGSNDIADDLADNSTNASIAKPVNERGKSGSPPDKRSRAHPVSLISPPNDKEEAMTTPNAPPLNLADDDDTTAPTETPTGFTYAKAVVGFNSHDEVQAERTDPDGSVKSVTTKSLAGVFSAALVRKHTLFLNIMFPTTPSKSDPTKTARAQLMNYIIMLQEVDETALLYRWEQISATEADACLKPAALPTSLTGLQSFAHQFRPNTDRGDCWCQIRVGFTKDPDEFMAELRAQAASRKWIAKKQPLQMAFTKHVGWLNYFPQETDVNFWAAIINCWFAVNFPSDSRRPPIEIGLEYRAILDGLGQDARKRMTDKEKWAKKAVHVVCKRGKKLQVTAMVRTFLQSKRFKHMCHLPSRLIPMLPYGYNPIFLAKYQEATMKYMKLTLYGTGHFTTFAFTSPDKPCNFLTGKKSTIWSLILRIKARNTEHPLFLALNSATKSQEKGGFVVTYCKAYEDEAVEKITNIAAYFMHHYGEESLKCFTPKACDAAKQTKWDKDNDRPITIMEQDLEDVMDEDIEWIENLGDVTFGAQKPTEVVLERPQLPKRSSRPSSTDDDMVGTFFPRQTAAFCNNQDDDESDALATNTNYSTPVNPTQTNDETRVAHPSSEASVAESSSEDSAGGV